MQDAFESRVQDVRDQASETLDHFERMIQTKVHRALHQLGVPTADELNRLTRRVNELNRNVEELARIRRSRKRPAARKSRTEKSAATG
jgi:poly(hydroxyalkanoate) granule-associated protein